MSVFKRVKVVMLPTNEKAIIHSYMYNLGTRKEPIKTYQMNGNSQMSYAQHLYFLSDDEIKEGDWFIRNTEIHQCYKVHYDKITDIEFKTKKDSVYQGKNTFWNKEYCKKIIATTDDLVYTKQNGHLGQAIIHIPQPSTSFIEKYVEAYNAGNPIIEVMVEYVDEGREEWVGSNEDGEPVWFEKMVPYVNHKDNTITIKRVKDSWNREEVIALIKEAHNRGYSLCLGTSDLIDIDKWISENL